MGHFSSGLPLLYYFTMKIVVVVFSANVLFNPQIGGLSGFYCGLNCAKWKPKGFYTEIRTAAAVEPESSAVQKSTVGQKI